MRLILGKVRYVTKIIVLYTGFEKFVARGYARVNVKIDHLADMRWHLFTRYSVDALKLPPTQAALKYRVFRCHYIALVLKSCSKSIRQLPDPTGYGWELKDAQMVPIMMDELPAAIGLIELSMCSCKGICDTNRCLCYKNNLTCTEMCKCSDECINDGIGDSIETDHLTDESDDEDDDFEDIF